MEDGQLPLLHGNRSPAGIVSFPNLSASVDAGDLGWSLSQGITEVGEVNMKWCLVIQTTFPGSAT